MSLPIYLNFIQYLQEELDGESRRLKTSKVSFVLHYIDSKTGQRKNLKAGTHSLRKEQSLRELEARELGRTILNRHRDLWDKDRRFTHITRQQPLS